MKHSRNTRRVAGISLAAAVAGAFALTPVGAVDAQEIKPGDVARGLNGLQSALDRNLGNLGAAISKTVKPGSGSTLSRYSSGGWTYTAVAYNPEADRIYAISTGEGGKPAGHLLRIKPDMDQLADLGPLDLRGINTKDVVSASVTPSGMYVLFSGPEIRVIDLDKDDLTKSIFADKITSASSLAVKTAKLTMPAGIGQIGVPSAWASGTDPERAHELYAVSRERDRMYKWTLDTNNGRVAVEPVTVRPGVTLDGIGELNYAFTKNDGTLVFADDAAKTIEVLGTEVTASYFGNTVVDNFRELAYLPVGAPYKPVTQFAKPEPLPGVYAPNAVSPARPNAAEIARDVAKIGDAASGLANAVGNVSTPTVVVQATEPAPAAPADPALSGTATNLSAAEGDLVDASAPQPEVVGQAPTGPVIDATNRKVNLTVADTKGYAVSNVAVDVPSLGIAETTNNDGQVVLDLDNVATPVSVYVNGDEFNLPANVVRYRVTTLAEGSETSTSTTTPSDAAPTDASPIQPGTNTQPAPGTDQAQPPAADQQNPPTSDQNAPTSSLVNAQYITVAVTDKNGKKVVGANVRSVDVTGVNTRTDSNGYALIQPPSTFGRTSYLLQVEMGDTIRTVPVENSTKLVPVEMPAAVSSTSTTTTTTGERKTVTVGITVKTDAGDPVQYAEVYSVHGLAIQVDGLTDANGHVSVTIPGNVGNGDTVELGVRTAPSGFRTATKSVSRKVDGETITLPKAPTTSTTSTKSTPAQILEVIEEVQPLIAALAGPAALGAGMANRGKSTTTTTARSTTLNGTVSTGRTTSVAGGTTAARATAAAGKATTTRSTTSASEREDDLADTGTPMSTVIALGILAMLIGGAYVGMGRRREA